MTTASILEQEEYQVETASDGPEALEKIEGYARCLRLADGLRLAFECVNVTISKSLESRIWSHESENNCFDSRL